MNETNIATVGNFLLLLSIALGVLVVVGIGLFAYRYNRLKEKGRSLSETEMLRRAELEWARDPANPANRPARPDAQDQGQFPKF